MSRSKHARRTLCSLTLALSIGVLAGCPSAARDPVEAPADVGPLVAVDVIRSDFTTLYAQLQEAHHDLYAHRSKPDYDRLYHQQLAAFRRDMPRLAVVVAFQKFVAFGGFGHARIDEPLGLFAAHVHSGGAAVPLDIRVDDGRVYLTRPADLAGALAPGDELLAIDGQPIAAWLTRLSAHVSAESPYMAWALMELDRYFSALLWLELGAVDSLQVTARKPGGATVEVRVAALTDAQFAELRARAAEPLDLSTREVRILPDGVAYLRPGPFYNVEATRGPAPSYEDSAYRRFLDAAFAEILASGARDLLIDLRNNPGGDNSFSDPMIAWFATGPFRFASRFTLKASAATKADYARLRARGEPIDGTLAALIAAEAAHKNGERYPFEIPLVAPRSGPRFTGKVYVLVHRRSFSNATAVAATVQDHGFAEVIGEPTADVPTGHGAAQHFDLPGLGVTVAYPKSYFVRPSGVEGVRGVVPDYPIPAARFFAPGDAALADAVAIVLARRGA